MLTVPFHRTFPISNQRTNDAGDPKQHTLQGKPSALPPQIIPKGEQVFRNIACEVADEGPKDPISENPQQRARTQYGLIQGEVPRRVTVKQPDANKASAGHRLRRWTFPLRRKSLKPLQGNTSFENPSTFQASASRTAWSFASKVTCGLLKRASPTMTTED